MSQPLPVERKIFTVSDLTRLIKKTLTDRIRYVWVQGEVSKPLVARSGHLYFDLKDEESLVKCKMWKPFVERLGFAVEHGREVLVYGEIDVYAPRGEYSITCTTVEPLGAGALQLRFEQLKKRLEAEGLFAPERKKPLPPLPATIGIVTSPDAAAFKDMIKTIFSRHPRAHVLLYPVKVQGAGAAEEIAAAIHTINLARPDVDVLIVGRGGGSLEDLWAFNEEVVARAIFASRIPVISAVGHETDVTIADFVADVRAKTPTDAGVIVVPDLRELYARMQELGSGLALALRNRVALERGRLDGLRTHYGLRRLPDHVMELSRRLDEFAKDLGTALSRRTADARSRLGKCTARLAIPAFAARLRNDRRALAGLVRALDHAASTRLKRDMDAVKSAAKRLDDLSPLGVLGRGYSITKDAQGRIVKDASKLREGDRLTTRLHKGSIESEVKETRP